jgi:hypothetical protein
MTHEEAFLLMMDSLDQVSNPADQDRLQRHLLVCHDCAAEWEALQAVDGLLLSVPMIAAPDGLSASVLGRLDDRRSWAATLSALFALGAGSVIALLGVGVPGVLLIMLFSTAYTDPARFTSWLTWLRGLMSVAGTLVDGLVTTLCLVFGQVASTPAALMWAFAAALAVGLWAHLLRSWEPVSIAPLLDN